MLDEIKEAIEALTSDMTRFGAIFFFGIVVFAVLIGLSYLPNAAGTALGKSITFSCPASPSLIIPSITKALTPGNIGASMIQCAVDSGNIGITALWYVEIQALMFVGAIVGITLLIIFGYFTG